MSSEEDYGGYGSEDDGYGFGSDEDDGDLDVENQYYSSKGLLEGGDSSESRHAALEGFRSVRPHPTRPTPPHPNMPPAPAPTPALAYFPPEREPSRLKIASPPGMSSHRTTPCRPP